MKKHAYRYLIQHGVRKPAKGEMYINRTIIDPMHFPSMSKCLCMLSRLSLGQYLYIICLSFVMPVIAVVKVSKKSLYTRAHIARRYLPSKAAALQHRCHSYPYCLFVHTVLPNACTISDCCSPMLPDTWGTAAGVLGPAGRTANESRCACSPTAYWAGQGQPPPHPLQKDCPMQQD